uniref:Retrovirus-related Pol polyprotein from transposon TNT 1-94 n=1 Tax=Cajanus cajan TaxID=3821 RepID=A0A151SBM9_CAJCA|nr:Retrovirus-related Pol polyprotein from transposon TNT 1-94 [Cajanus cajan]
MVFKTVLHLCHLCHRQNLAPHPHLSLLLTFPIIVNNHPIQTRSKTRVHNSRLQHFTEFLAHSEPKGVKQALTSPDWLSSMQQESTALIQNQTWDLVSLPSDKKAVGFHGFDFHETFSPYVKPITIRIIITLALTNNWELFQLDVNNAFLNDFLEETVYMVQPSRFEVEDKSPVHKLC